MKLYSKNHLARLILSTIAAPVALLFTVSQIHADALTWDADAGTAGAQDGASLFSWTTGAGNWRNTTSSTDNVNWTAGDAATFGAGTDGTYTVAVGGPITTGAGTRSATAGQGGIVFSNSGYSLTAASAQTVTLGATTGNVSSVVNVASGKTATIGSNVTLQGGSGTGGLFLLDGGTLEIATGGTLTGNSTGASSVAGGGSTLRINGGTASFGSSLSMGKLANANAEAASGNLIVDSGSLTLGGAGNLSLGRTSGDLCVVTLNNGTITAAGGNLAYGLTTLTGTGSFFLNGGTLTVKSVTSTPQVSSFFSFNGGTLKAAASAAATFMTGLDIARIRDGAANIDTNGQAITIGQVLTHSAVGGDNPIDGGLTLNDSAVTKGTLSLTAANTFNGPTKITAGILSLENSLAIQSSPLDTLNSVVGDASNGLKTALAALTIGGLTGNKNLADVFTTTSGGYSGVTALTLNPGSAVTHSYSGDIVNGAMTLTKSGAGAQILTGANTHDSLTTISAGALIAAANNALGSTVAGTTVGSGASLGLSGGIDYTTTETITGSGPGSAIIAGTLPATQRGLIQSVSGNNTFRGNVVVDAGGTTRFGSQDGASLTLTGTITQATGSILFRAGSGLLNAGGDFVTLSNASNSFGANSTVFTNATTGYSGVRLGITNALPTGLTISGLGGGTPTAAGTALDLNAFNQTLNGLTGTAPLNIINTNTVTASTLTVNPTADQSTAGTVILGGTGLSGTLGTINVIKDGTFTQTLAGVNTYTGTTTINAGTLVITGATLGTSAITFGGGVLGLDIATPVTAANAAVNLAGGTVLVTGPPTLPSHTLLTASSIVGTPTLSVAVPGYSLQISGGNQLRLVQNSGSPYDSWASTNGLTGLPGSSTDPAKGADPDNDGRNNIGEFAFNGDPLSGSDNGKVYVLTEDSDFAGDPSSAKELILTVAVRTGTLAFAGSPSPSATQAADGITYSIEGSLDLASFPTTVNVVSPVITGLPADPGTGYEYRSFSLDGSNGLAGKGFLRAKVTSP